MADEEIKKAPCEFCGGECKILIVLYSCPVQYEMQCTKCGQKIRREGKGGIKVLTLEESIRMRPQMYAEDEDPARRAIALDELERRRVGGNQTP